MASQYGGAAGYSASTGYARYLLHDFWCDGFECSTPQVMRDPVIAGDGHSYEREAIERWLQGITLPFRIAVEGAAG